MPTRNALIFAAAAWAATAAASVWVAGHAVTAFEAAAERRLTAALTPGDAWLSVSADGTVLTLSGKAPDPAARRAALGRLGALPGGMTLNDTTRAGRADPVRGGDAARARPVLEILRNADGVTLIGRQPQAELAGRLPAFGDVPLIDMREVAAGAAPRGWPAARDLALAAARALQAGHVTARPGAVSVSASARGPVAAAALRARLRDARPAGVALRVDVSAPRPVIAPFRLSVTLPEGGAPRVAACAAPDAAARARILARLADLGAAPAPGCAVGPGAPGPGWTDAALAGLDALARIGAGRLTLTDADMALAPGAGITAAEVRAAADALAAALPQGFSLTPIAAPRTAAAAPPAAEAHEFTAVRTDDGAVRLRGVLGDVRAQQTARSFARAQFGFDTVIDETRLAGDLPAGWAARALGGLAALGELRSGQVQMTAAGLALTGVYAGADGPERLRAALAAHGIAAAQVRMDVWQRAAITPDRRPGLDQAGCAAHIALLTRAQPIVFPPGKASIAEESRRTVARIAETLAKCPGARFEIEGHTDSQGGEGSNMALSQARAAAVLEALLERGVDTVFLHARGYGETRPVASNETEAGRARNRRITFRPVSAPAPGESVMAGGGEDTAGDEGAAGGEGDAPAAARARTAPAEAVELQLDPDAEGASAPKVADAAAEDAAAPGAKAAAAPDDPDAPPRPRPRPADLAPPGDG